MSDSLTVPWPAAPLGAIGWRRRLEDLASRAESFIGKDCSLQQTAELGLELIGLVWPALGPETVAATARASVLLNMPVLMATAPADQVQEIADRLDKIWLEAQQHPGAGVAQLPAPMLSELVPTKKPRTPRRPKPAKPEPAPAPAAAEDFDDLPAAWLDCPEPLPVVITPEPEPRAPAPSRPLRPLAERIAPRPAAEPRVEPTPTPTPTPRRRLAPAPVPPGWFSAAEVAELVEVEPCSVGRWRKEGRLGDEGTGWQRCGRMFYFAPDAVENIDRTRIPGGLDQLVAEVQAP